MAEYQWATKDGKIVTDDYNRSMQLTHEEIIDELKNAFNCFGRNVDISDNVENLSDVYKVNIPSEREMLEVYICAKGTTPGGRNNLKNEQRIQPKAKYLNYVFEKYVEGKKSIFLGIYKWDSEVVFCAWKLMESNANPENPISKQIKIETISNALTEGFARQLRGAEEYVCAFRKEFIYFYLKNYEWLHSNFNFGASKEGLLTLEEDKPQRNNFNIKYPHNRIVFGAPGTGKSNKLKQDSKELLQDGGSLERVTFYPDYSYSQFVGTYKPVTDETGEISYQFVPGPFMRVYVNAIKNPDKPYLLLIEEINRAKVASVFGDVFQLLDRDENGLSEYDIQTSEDVKKYLMKELGDHSTKWDHMKIPSNMFIWATMNSADQGVFPMDTAFKRRWNFDYLGINENEDKLDCKLITVGRGDFAMNIKWNQLRRAINEKLSRDYKLNEDKLMGPFFLAKSVVENDNSEEFVKAFKNKVIMYLYEDAAKQYKSKLFSGCDDMRYSLVCEVFDEKGIGVFGADFIDIYNQQEG